jgi:glycolate oxidase iron-sulfur subunit
VNRRESESPRGRIALMRTIAAAAEALDTTSREHCLACGRCERVCPAGVRYLDLLDLSRSRHPPRRSRWLTLASRLRTRIVALPAAAWATELVAAVSGSARLQAAATALRAAQSWRRPAATPAVRPLPSSDLFLLAGCGSALQSDAVAGALHLLARLGHTPRVSTPFSCCGALERHRGDATAADRSLQQLADATHAAGARTVAAVDSGCARELDRHGAAAGCAPSDLLTVVADAMDERDVRLAGGSRRVGLFRPCTQEGAGAIALDRLLRRIDDLEIVPIAAGHGCCGAAGEYFIDQPALSQRLAAPVVDAIAAARLDAVVTANLGCRLQLAAGLAARGDRTPVHHLLGFMASLSG